MKMSKLLNINVGLSIVSIIVLLVFIYISGNYTLTLTSDDWVYAFLERSGWEHLHHNFFKWNGRWGQGLTNDYRFYKNRSLFTLIFNLFFVGSIYLFFTRFFDRKKAIIVCFFFYTTILYSSIDFFQLTLYFPSLLSYTFGSSLFLIIIYLLLSDKKYSFTLATIILIFQNGLVESFAFVNSCLFLFVLVVFLIKNKRFNKKLIILTFVSVLSFLIIYFSPGNKIRRERPDAASLSLNLDRFLNDLQEFMINHLNIGILITILIIILLLNHERIGLKRIKNQFFIGIIVFILLSFFLIPLFLNQFSPFLKSLGRLANTSTVLFFMGSFFSILLIIPKKAILKGNQVQLVILILFFMFWIPIFIFKENNIQTLFNQVVSGKLKDWNEEECSRREYLINTYNAKPKELPLYSTDYFNEVFNYTPIDELLKNNNKTFVNFFNNKYSVKANKDMPDIRVINLVEKIKEGKVKPFLKEKDYHYFKSNRTLILQRQSDSIDKIDLVFLNEKNLIFKSYNSFSSNQKSPYFKKNNDYVGFQIKKPTSFIKIGNKKISIEEDNWFSLFKAHNNEINPKTTLKKKDLEVKFNNSKLKFKVTFVVKILKNDEVELFYLLNNKYTKKVKEIKGSNQFQQIEFLFTELKEIPHNLRFDYASILEQEITIKKIVIQNSDTLITINQNQVKDYFNSPDQWNVDINTERAIFGVKKNNNRIDPKLLGNNKLRNTLKTLK